MRAVLLVTMLMNVLLFPYQHMLPVFARDVLRRWARRGSARSSPPTGWARCSARSPSPSRRGLLPHGRSSRGAVLVAPFLLVALLGSRWRWPCASCCWSLMGAAESGFAAMQSTLVLLAAPERRARRRHGHPLGLHRHPAPRHARLGLLATGIGVAAAMALNSVLALAAIAPVAVALWRRSAGRAE